MQFIALVLLFSVSAYKCVICAPNHFLVLDSSVVNNKRNGCHGLTSAVLVVCAKFELAKLLKFRIILVAFFLYE